MKRYFVYIIIFLTTNLLSEAQTSSHSLNYYLEKALQNNVLHQDEHNQTTILNSQSQYLKNVYTHAQTLIEGNYLFVPIISTDNGTTSFEWNAQSADNYYGYDLGVSNGNLQCEVTWSKPLLGNIVYKTAEAQINIQKDILINEIKLNNHDLERNVIDQYILCLFDQNQLDLTDSITNILTTQLSYITKLAEAGQAKQSDIQLLIIEQYINNEKKVSYSQSYYNHLMELNALCCISDTETVKLAQIIINQTNVKYNSQFLTKYDLDSINIIASQLVFETRYKPQLNIFTNAGLQTTHFKTMYNNLGFSAGIKFSILLSDGKLKKIKQCKTNATLSSIEIYKTNLIRQNNIRIHQCLSIINDYDNRTIILDKQINEYNILLNMSHKEIISGQMSVFDYITTLKNIISVKQQKLTVDANRKLAINAYNYYNW